MKELYSALVFAAFVSLSAGAAWGNDTLSSISTSGVEFKKSAEIVMRTEDLQISEQTIRVRYEFYNDSDHDVEGTVSFPLPSVVNQEPYAVALERRVKGKSVRIENPFQFELKVNGQPKRIHLHETADHENKMDDDCEDACTYHFNYYWRQKFPARQSVIVEHSYRTGYGAGTYIPGETAPSECVAPADEAAIRQKAGQAFDTDTATQKLYGNRDNFIGNYFHYNAISIEYILQTAKNWHGPIGHFKLTVDKGASGAVLAACWPTAWTQTGPTQYMFEQDNFVPERDLKLLIIRDPDVVLKAGGHE